MLGTICYDVIFCCKFPPFYFRFTLDKKFIKTLKFKARIMHEFWNWIHKYIDFDPKTLIKISKLGLTEKSFRLVSLFCCYVILLTLHLFEWQKTFMSILLGFISPRTSIIELTCTTHLGAIEAYKVLRDSRRTKYLLFHS